MSTEFSFEHVFRAPSKDAVLSAYFDPDHLATQDQVADLTDRVVVETHEDDTIKKTVWTVSAAKSLPLYARPFVEGGRLKYREQMTWRKADDQIDLVITPQILGGRVSVNAIYALADIGPGQVRRRYGGTVTVDVKLISGKVERGIVSEIEKGMPLMFQCTQDWLARKHG